MSRTHPKSGPGFIEALIILIILGLAAVVMIPRFASGGTDTRENALRMSLKTVRNQIHLYRIQHNETNPTLDGFVNQMTRASNAIGETAPLGTPGYPFGPYLKRIPTNPYTITDTISTAPRGTSAWYYHPETGEFRTNHN
jgi:general secretion pathway protein G